MWQTARLCALKAILTVILSGAPVLSAWAQTTTVPTWLQAHVGFGEGQIAPVVLDRARTLYRQKRADGSVGNPCYFAMDATRPSATPEGTPAARFYTICEDRKTFRAVSSGYGNGRKLAQADFSNGRYCARHFSNAEGSKLTAGGAYLTAESRTSFKGYIREDGERAPFLRTFLVFDGEGETDNARERAIGGHAAVFVKWQCRIEDPDSPHADDAGFVPFGRLVTYTGGRSNGCTTWKPAEAEEILKLAADNPTTLYLYPASADIDAVAQAVRAGTPLAEAGLYWNATCLDEIGTPRFWPKAELQPIIDRWRQSLPKVPPRDLPICD